MNISQHPLLHESQQLLVVSAKNMNAFQGELNIFYRNKGQLSFERFDATIPVVLGKNGLAWDQDFVDTEANSPIMREGAERSPAGIFTLGTAYGRANYVNTKLNYQKISENTFCIDDCNSSFYNQVVEYDKNQKNWQTAEAMYEMSNDVYRYAIFINYNSQKIANRGSCIFMHVWKSENEGTAGCTAMSENNLLTILQWLDPAKKPILIQLPEEFIPDVLSNQK